MLPILLFAFFSDSIFIENPRDITATKMSDLAKLETYIKLETTDDSLLGNIDKAIYDEPRKRFIVGDFDSSKSIKVFADDGSYIKDIGRKGEGPGEFKHQIHSFDVDDKGNIYVLESLKILKFGPNGDFIKERKTLDDFIPSELAIIKDTIFISLLRSKSQKPHDIQVFDSELQWKSSFSPYNAFRENYLYSPPSRLDRFQGNLYVSRMYSPEIAVYNTEGTQIKTISAKQTNRTEFEEAIRTFEKNHEGRRQISNYTHRFFAYEPFGNKFLVCDQTKKPTFMKRLFIVDDKEIIRVNGYAFYDSRSRGKELSLTWIPGHYKRGIIGMIEYDEVWEAKKGDLPGLETLNLTIEDNPALLLLQPKDNY